MKRLLLILPLLAGAVFFPGSSAPASAPALDAPPAPCRFGITAPLGITGYLGALAELNACSLLTWAETPPGNMPGGMEFVHVIRTRNDPDLGHISSLVAAYPGAVWEVGNEPDTCYEYQDCASPEVYAQRFYDIATQIRSDDPTARIGFGTVVQPTPVRLRYLQRAWNQLVTLAGSASAASALIDFWNVHSFILEERDTWGTGTPPGFTCERVEGQPNYGMCWDEGPAPDPCTSDTCWPLFHVTDFAQTHSITIYSQRIRDLRAWMASVGEQGKPLWVTEYGSLLPPIDPPGGPDWVNVSDADTAAFMTATFDFMLSATDGATGYPADGYRLVQRWFWYSLNDYRYKFGGTLYDPDNNGQRTLVGDAWVEYRTPPVSTWYLAEGYTGGLAETFILIQNPNAQEAHVNVTYMLQPFGIEIRHLTVAPSSRFTIRVNDDAAMVDPGDPACCAFSTRLDADQPIIVERAMYWPNGTPQNPTIGGHNTTGVRQPAVAWYLAEGFTGAGFSTFILIQNPNDAPANVDLTYMLQPSGTVAKNLTVPANSRATVWVNAEDQLGLDQAFSTRLVSDVPIIVERAMYFNNEGHDATGVTTPQTTWYLAEGYTAVGFGTFILIQNPNEATANVEVTYMLQGGGTETRNLSVAANSRDTIVVQADPELVDKAFSTQLVSDLPIIVERAMYWPNGEGTIAGHDSPGVTGAATTWNLAEGYTGGGFGTFILIQNPNGSEADVAVTYMLQGGGTVQKDVTVAANSRYTIVVHDPSQLGPDKAFSTKLVSDLPIIVERAMYFNNGGHGTTGVSEP